MENVMSHRINVMLDDEVWESLSQLPKGERSRFINQALQETLLRQRREEAFARIEELRKQMEPLGMSAEEWIRRDRDSHE
jgi:metal-responsive CopG/Arc/MetJ family transcriptional regulator